VFGALYGAEGTGRASLEAVAREFSPRIEVPQSDASSAETREIVLDLSGLARLFGDARTIAQELRRTAADRGLRVRVGIAGTRTAARLIVRHRAGITVVEPGTEADALAPLPLALLDALISEPTSDVQARIPNSLNPNGQPAAPGRPAAAPGLHVGAGRVPRSRPVVDTLRRWGLRTLGDLAALPPDDVAARLGQDGVQWQRLARGEDPRPLVPAIPDERFEQALDLEWPIEGLEPLSFVFGRLMEPLEAHLARRDRGAAVLHVRLHLVTKAIHERSLQLPAPMRDARALRTLALLDLEFHPPAAAIDRVVVAVDPTPGRVVQFSLLTRPLPSPEQLSTLIARLTALMGENRCGSPAVVDTWQPGTFALRPFAPRDDSALVGRVGREQTESIAVDRRTPPVSPLPTAPALSAAPAPSPLPIVALRRFRIPVPARVRVEDGRPVRVMVDRRGFSSGHITQVAGPWRTSGAWWVTGPRSDRPGGGSVHEGGGIGEGGWDRDEWDVALHDGTTYRVFRERDADRWFVEGVVD
jgi:protein ImuB